MNRKNLLLAAVCVSAAALGYFASIVFSPGTGMKRQLPPPRTHPRRIEVPDKANLASRHLNRSEKQLASLRADLCRRFSTSPLAKTDWALRESAAAILSTMSTAELRDFASELAPPYNRTNPNNTPPEWQNALMCEIFRHWGLLDPTAACLGLTDKNDMGGPDLAFNDWMERDPSAVAEWLDSGSFPPRNEVTISRARIRFIDHLATTDFPAAREAMMKLKPKEQEMILFGWSNIFPRDPEKRIAVMDLLKNLTDPEWVKECRENIVNSLTRKSPEEAFAFVKASALPEAEQRGMEDSILGVWARKDLDGAFARWKERNEPDVPMPLLQAVSIWSSDPPGTTDAIEWVISMERGPVRDQFQKHLVNSLSRGQHYREAAELGFCLSDPGERKKILKTVRNSWEQHDWSAASEWFAGHLADERVTGAWNPVERKPD